MRIAIHIGTSYPIENRFNCPSKENFLKIFKNNFSDIRLITLTIRVIPVTF
jgi:hypothetical protein